MGVDFRSALAVRQAGLRSAELLTVVPAKTQMVVVSNINAESANRSN